MTTWWSGKPDEVLEATVWRLNTVVFGLCVFIPIGFMIYLRRPRQSYPGIQGTSQTQVDVLEPILAALTILLVVLVIRIYQNRYLKIFPRGIRYHTVWTGFHVIAWDDIDRVESKDVSGNDPTRGKYVTRSVPQLILSNGDRVVLRYFIEGDGIRTSNTCERLREWKARSLTR
jgi:hypothetical protein